MTLKRALPLFILAAMVVVGLQNTAIGQGISTAVTTIVEGTIRASAVVLIDSNTNAPVVYATEDRNAGPAGAATLRTVESTDGATPFYKTSAGSAEDEHEVKSTAGVLYGVIATNTNASARYLRCANQVIGSTTPGSTTVYFGWAIPGNTGGSGASPNLGPKGIAFSTGLTCWVVTGAADTDATEVAANEVKITYAFK